MGYVTNFTLRIHANPDVQLVDKDANEKVAAILNKVLADEDVFEYAGIFEDQSDGEDYIWESNDAYKWYDHDDDMKKISLMVPDVVLELSGIGEEDDDKWKTYYLNGKMHECRAQITITYPNFDPSQLK